MGQQLFRWPLLDDEWLHRRPAETAKAQEPYDPAHDDPSHDDPGRCIRRSDQARRR